MKLYRTHSTLLIILFHRIIEENWKNIPNYIPITNPYKTPNHLAAKEEPTWNPPWRIFLSCSRKFLKLLYGCWAEPSRLWSTPLTPTFSYASVSDPSLSHDRKLLWMSTFCLWGDCTFSCSEMGGCYWTKKFNYQIH